MQAAFGFAGAAPAAGTFVGFTFGNSPGAGPATDAGVTLVVQRIVRHVLCENAIPNVFLRKVRQRADLHEIELFIPTDDRGLGPIGTLVAADATHPGVFALGGLAQHFDLAIEAALIGVRLVERPAVQRLVFGNRQLRLEHVDLDAIFLRDAISQVERLLKLVAGVEIKDISLRRYLGEHRQNHTPLGAKRGGHREVRAQSDREPRR